MNPIGDEDTSLIYKTDSAPVRSPAEAKPFASLLVDLDQTQQILSAALQAADDADLDRQVENDGGSIKVMEHLQGFHWHETYHLGQLDLLRAYLASHD